MSYKSIEDSGYTAETLCESRKIGIFVGVMNGTYTHHSSYWSIANRVSYLLNFQGPSMAVDTACSSSLTAIHLALESLYSGMSDCAIAGGVNLILRPIQYLGLSAMTMLSLTNKCKPFGDHADGFVDGEGVGALVLKPLKKAIAENDHIYGVLKGSIVNSGGKTNGYTVPNPKAQHQLISEVLNRSGIDARAVSYIEAHGTGTTLGDPIEISGLTRAFEQHSQDRQYCSIGSVKSNIGHCESAAGIAGVTKVLMQMKYAKIVPSLHSHMLNPNIDFASTPFVVNQELRDWQAPVIDGREYARIAGISSFGAGGSNAHLIIQEWPPPAERRETRDEGRGKGMNNQRTALIVLSAKNEDRLKEVAKNLYAFLTSPLAPRPLPLYEVAYTLQVGRETMEERLAVMVRSLEELQEKLQGFMEGLDGIDNLFHGQVKRNRDALAVFASDEDTATLVDTWIAKGKYAKLLDLWVKGFAFDWSKLYSDVKPRRISLPTYPFAKERYWLPESPSLPSNHKSQISNLKSSWLHPLVHENTSNFEEQRFSSTFTGKEFFLTDHVVKGQKVFPGVAYLEMAREAVKQASGALSKESQGIRLKNVVWARSIAVNDPKKVHIGLFPEERGEISYEIYTSHPVDGKSEIATALLHQEEKPVSPACKAGSAQNPTDFAQVATTVKKLETQLRDEIVVHSQGVARFVSSEKIPSLKLSNLQEKLNQNSLSCQACYKAFKRMGIDYGPAHQGLEKIYVGDNEVLAKLTLPACVSGTKDQFILHPSLLDSALQASIGLYLRSETDASHSAFSLQPPVSPFLPFALDRLEIMDRCPESVWAWVRLVRDSGMVDNAVPAVQKLDIDLYDGSGHACVKMRGFTSRAQEGELNPGKGLKSYGTETEGHNFSRASLVLNKGGKSETYYVGSSLKSSLEVSSGLIRMSPVWNSLSIEKMEVLPEKNTQLIILGGTQKEINEIKTLNPQAKALTIEPHATIDAIARQLKEQGDIEHLVWIAPNKNVSLTSLGIPDIIQEQTQGVLQVFRIIKALLSLGYAERDLAWTLITEQTQAVRIDDQVNPTHASAHGLIGSLAKEYLHWKIRFLDMNDSPWPILEMFSLPYNAQGNALAYRDKEWFSQELLPVKKLALQGNLYKTGGVYVVIGGSGGIGEVWSKWMLENYQAQIIWIGRRNSDTAIQKKLDKLSTFGPVPMYVQADAANAESLQKAYAHIKQKHAQIHGVIHSAIVLSDSSLANMDEELFRAGLKAKVDVSVCLAQVFEKEPLDFVLFFSSMIAFGKAAGQSNYAAGCTFKDAFARRLAQDWSCPVKVMNWGYWGSVGIVTDPSYQARMERAGIGSIEPEEGMEALETLINGPLDQLALLKTLTADALGTMGGMNANEWISSYPQTLPSNTLQTLKEPLSNQEEKWDQTLSTESLPDPDMEAFVRKLLLGNVHGFLQSPKGLLDRFDRWLQESFSLLLAQNYLRKQDSESYTLVDPVPNLNDLWAQWDDKKVIWSGDVNKKAQLDLLEVCLRALPEILTGEQQATDVMFPNSSMELVEGIYKGNAVSDLFNDVLWTTVERYLEERLSQDSSAQIRVLEIGAGTGGTTAGLLAKLRPFQDNIGEYCYTDISKAFLMHAQEHYAPQAPYLTTEIFDVGKPISGQGIKANSYDIVIAANVLHATQSMRQTLRNAKAPLRKGGLLLLNELSDKSLFAHLTFGLLEGWWLYEDPQLRIPGSPGLFPKTWAKVLREEGFVSTFFPAAKIHPMGQQIIVAQSDGIVRQNQVASKVPLVKQEIKENVLTKLTPEKKPPKANKESISKDLLREKSTIYLKKLVGETLKMPTSKIDSSEPLEKYGIDSILVVQLTNTMRRVFENISSTLFFEVQTINGLVDYLMKSQKEALIRQVGLEEQTVLSEEKSVAEITPSSVLSRRSRTRRSRRFSPVFGSEKERPSSQICQVQDVAIIGLSGRYPGAKNVNEFWENLKTGKNCIREIPKDRWDWREFFDDEKGKSGKIYSKWGGFIEGVGEFDPLFFSISPREAEYLDPQERLFLETVWNVLESAGYSRETLENRYQSKVGVYVGAMYQQYHCFNSDISKKSAAFLSSFSSIANRVSYFFDFQGPSVAVDTMCSSSTLAIHMACESLVKGECRLAIAGGVNLSIHPRKYLALCLTQMIGSHPNCRSFGDGDGFLPAEGVGVVLLKPLSQAVRDENSILAVIKSTASNHGGRSNGFSVPNPNAQAQLIEDNFRKCDIDPRTVSYAECAANGSSLGDPIEITALTKAFRQYTEDQHFCAIGSVKSNIGHPEAASGIAQLTKIVLQLQHQQLVPLIKATPLNPNLSFDKTPFYLQQELQEWQRPVLKINGEEGEVPRRATVSSFGAGGSNAHLIIEEWLPPVENQTDKTDHSDRSYLIVLSAKNPNRLKEVVKNLHNFLTSPLIPRPPSLHEVAYTLQVGREHMEERLAFIAGNGKELLIKLGNYLEDPETLQHDDGVFVGNVENDRKDLQILVSDGAGRDLIQQAVEHQQLTKLALLWVKGIDIPWRRLYQGRLPTRVPLPTYPFERKRYWISSSEIANSSPGHEDRDENQIRVNPGHLTQANIETYLTQLVSQLTKIPVADVKANKTFYDYGLDSLTGRQLLRQLEERFTVKLSGEKLLQYNSINALSDYLTPLIAADSLSAMAPDQTLQTEPQPLTPLSEGQKGLWVLQKLSPEMSAYNVPIALRFRQALSVDNLKQACEFLLNQYPILKTLIEEQDGIPFQRINDHQPLYFEQQTLDAALSDEAIIAHLSELVNSPFNLQTGPLLRVHLLSLGDQQQILLITIHHIICDGSSILPLITTLLDTYQDLIQNKIPNPIAYPTDYADFVHWEQNFLKSEEGEIHRAYWKNQFSGELPVLALPTDRPRPSTQRFQGKTHSIQIDTNLSRQLKTLAQIQQLSPAVVFLGIFKALLYRYTGQKDLLIGVPTAGRPERRFENVIGYFVNMVVIRSQPMGDKKLANYLKELQTIMVQALDYAAYPFPRLVTDLNIQRDPALSPLFQVTFAFQNFIQANALTELNARYQQTLAVEVLEGLHQEGEFDLGLEVFQQEDHFLLNLKYNPELFEESTIERLLGHYINLAKQIVATPKKPLSDYDILTPAERHQLLVDWNDTQANYPKDQCIHQLFEAQARKTPNAVAVVFEEQKLSYKELNQKSTELAKYLQSLGVKPDTLVAICVERSLEMIIGLLGILKAGGAYVPLDPDYPEERLQHMLEDCRAELLLSHSHLTDRAQVLAKDNIEIVYLDQDWQTIKDTAKAQKRFERSVRSNHLAYVIYTSGSTGRPKGVMIEHHSFVNMSLDQIGQFKVSQSDSCLQLASACFDASLSEIFMALLSGSTLVILNKNKLQILNSFHDFCNQNQISVATLSPSFLRSLNHEKITSLRTLITAGEAANWSDVRYYSKSVDRCINAYGPTEAAVCVSTYTVPSGFVPKNLPIGKPMANTKIYILSSELGLLPVGIPGKLCVAGVGLCRGYLNQVELTTEKFIDNPFEPGTRLYRTGDLARWLPDGNIEFLGRMDDQIKLRGFRIELGEIESQLNSHPAIQNNIVIVNEQNNNKQLIAYYVLEDDQTAESADLKTFLAQQLPDYMIPVAFIELDVIPLTPNGKVDRKKLAMQDVHLQSTQAYVAPRNETEQKLVEIWQEVLNLEKVGIHDNFFEFGGNSILILRLQHKINQNISAEIKVTDLFKYPNIGSLSALLDKTTPLLDDLESEHLKQARNVRKKRTRMRNNDG